jgi:hypothetical protein
MDYKHITEENKAIFSDMTEEEVKELINIIMGFSDENDEVEETEEQEQGEGQGEGEKDTELQDSESDGEESDEEVKDEPKQESKNPGGDGKPCPDWQDERFGLSAYSYDKIVRLIRANEIDAAKKAYRDVTFAKEEKANDIITKIIAKVRGK